MKTCIISRVVIIVFTVLIITIIAGPANAEKGVIAYVTRKCFVIKTNSGFVIVDGWVSANKGDTVIGNFDSYGGTDMFDIDGNKLSGYIYIEEYGLSKSRFQSKWGDKFDEKCN